MGSWEFKESTPNFLETALLKSISACSKGAFVLDIGNLADATASSPVAFFLTILPTKKLLPKSFHDPIPSFHSGNILGSLS